MMSLEGFLLGAANVTTLAEMEHSQGLEGLRCYMYATFQVHIIMYGCMLQKQCLLR